MKCQGDSFVTYYPPGGGCQGQRGKALFTCDGGRKIEADWLAQKCTLGTGTGKDEFGNTFTFAFGLSKGEADRYVANALPEAANKPKLTDNFEERAKQQTITADIVEKGIFPIEPVNLKYPVGNMKPDDIAIIIGNSNYTKFGKDIPNVTPAYADAEAFRQYAMTSLGIAEDNIIYIRDATLTDMVATFGNDVNHKGQAYNWTKAGFSNIYVYYSGHGAPSTDSDSSSYLVPTNAKASLIKLSGYKLDTLYKNLAKIPAKSVTVVVEACFSGTSQSGSVITNASPVYITPKDVKTPDNLTIISAGASNQIASWEEDKSHGLFTKYYLSAMSGEADKAPYGNGDGVVDDRELEVYMAQTMTYFAKRYYGRDQTMQLHRAKNQMPVS